jgi:hypothetical protein
MSEVVLIKSSRLDVTFVDFIVIIAITDSLHVMFNSQRYEFCDGFSRQFAHNNFRNFAADHLFHYLIRVRISMVRFELILLKLVQGFS